MLSPRRQNRCSPSKQNLSPTLTKKTSQKQQKYLTPELLLASVHELQTIILGLGGRVPVHLQHGFDCGLGLIRIQKCEDEGSGKEILGLRDQIKNLKIKLSNYEFEVKKLEEDSAQFKLITKMQRDKQVKKLKAQIAKLQLHGRQDNNKWETKISEMRDIYQNNMNKAIKEKTEACQKKIKEIKQKVQKQAVYLTEKYERMIKEMQEAHILEVNQLKAELEVKMAKKQQVHAQQIEKMRVKNIQIVQKLQKKQEQIITSYDSQKKVQIKKQDQQKISANKLKQKLYNDLYLVRRQKQQLNKKIIELKSEILEKTKERQRKQLQMKEMSEMHKLEIDKNQVKYIHEIEKIKHAAKLEIVQICKQHDQKLQEYQNVLKRLQEIKLNREQLLREGNQEVYKKFQSRPSKVEDTTVIQKLNFELLNKEEELNSARFQLKQAKMQRQNNQKNYTRIFSATPFKQREIKERFYERPNTASNRQRIYKTANTIDMSFLLKACNKNF